MKTTLDYYKKFRLHSPFMLVGRNAEMALRSAKTLLRFEELEAEGKVRMKAEDEYENYFDVYGEPETENERKEIIHQIETYGCVYVCSEINNHCECCDNDEWEVADSIGMCIYKNPLSPFENCYVIDLMAAAIKHFE